MESQDTAPPELEPLWLTEERVRHILAVIVLYVVGVSVILRPVADPDLFWHLRTARWILDHHGFPDTDPFSSQGVGQAWVAYSWLFELIVYGAYSLGSLQGVMALRMVLCLIIVWRLHRLARRAVGPGPLAAFLATLGVSSMLITFDDRPWLWSAIFLSIVLERVLEFREGRGGRWIWALPVLFLLWANLHVQFVYGLLVVGLAVLDPGKASRRTAFILAAACTLVTLVNPVGWRLWEIIRGLGQQKGAYLYLTELQSPDFRSIYQWVGLALMGTAVFALGRRARTEPFDLLLVVASVVFSIRAERDVWFSTQVALAYLGPAFPRGRVPLERLPRPFAFGLLGAEVLGCLLATVVLYLRLGYPSRENLEHDLAAAYPVAAVAEIKAKGYPGPLYNHLDWGGFLIWALPDIPVSMDGRTNLHGDARTILSLRTWDASTDQPDPDLESARLVIGQRTLALTRILEHDPRFKLVYEDALARVFVRI